MKLLRYRSEVVETVSFHEGKLSFYSHACPTDEDRINQDSAGFFSLNIKNCSALMVCDGLGGHENGAEASGLAVEVIERELMKVEDKKLLLGATIEAIEKAHESIRKDFPNAGTTLVLGIVNGTGVRFFNVGDSIGWVIGSRGAIRFKTKEHGFAGHAIEAGLLKEREALEHPNNHMINNCLGLEPFHIDVSPVIEMSNMDLILMSTDGLTGNLLSKDIEEETIKGRYEDRLVSIVERARAQMLSDTATFKSPDDMTTLLFQFQTNN